MFADGFGGVDDWGEVGVVLFVNGGGQCQDDDVGLLDDGGIGAVLDCHFLELLWGELRGPVVPFLERRDAFFGNVIPDDAVPFFGKRVREGEADVAEADDADSLRHRESIGMGLGVS